jgi:hypothetical protein
LERLQAVPIPAATGAGAVGHGSPGGGGTTN